MDRPYQRSRRIPLVVGDLGYTSTCASSLRRARGVKIMLGDWTFAAAGEARERMVVWVGGEDEILISLLHEVFDEFAELHQHERTLRRLPREAGGASVFS